MNKFKGIFYRNFYNDHIPDIFIEMYVDRIYKNYEKKEAIVLDIGANVGLFTHYTYNFASKIYAIEPSSLHFETLTKMLEFNEMTDKVIPIKCALSNQTGKAKFYKSLETNTTMYSLSEIVAPDKKDFEEVELETFETLFEKYKINHIDIAKVDIEGEELKVFVSDSFANIASKIDTIFVEYHPWTNINPSLLAASIADRGFKVTKLNTRATVLVATKI